MKNNSNQAPTLRIRRAGLTGNARSTPGQDRASRTARPPIVAVPPQIPIIHTIEPDFPLSNQ